MGDLIRRQDAIEACRSVADNINSSTDQQIGAEYCLDLIKKIPSVEPERKTKIEMNWATYFDDMGIPVIHIPYSYKCGNCGCQLQRTYDGIDINYCPECGYRLEWK